MSVHSLIIPQSADALAALLHSYPAAVFFLAALGCAQPFHLFPFCTNGRSAGYSLPFSLFFSPLCPPPPFRSFLFFSRFSFSRLRGGWPQLARLPGGATPTGVPCSWQIARYSASREVGPGGMGGGRETRAVVGGKKLDRKPERHHNEQHNTTNTFTQIRY